MGLGGVMDKVVLAVSFPYPKSVWALCPVVEGVLWVVWVECGEGGRLCVFSLKERKKKILRIKKKKHTWVEVAPPQPHGASTQPTLHAANVGWTIQRPERE